MMVPGLFRDLNASDPISSDHCCVRCGALSCDAGSETRADPDTCDEGPKQTYSSDPAPYHLYTFYILYPAPVTWRVRRSCTRSSSL